ncbi:FMN-binding protein [Demequina sp. NBRC 110051]|uniref:FMN-binding protein n=1 Tax=Demequina sp. NBRC 110051 TaxID=1570340 RepID=UPI000A029EB3|nr:FMN-binding protein [Demequina sp. NBRC 110051]
MKLSSGIIVTGLAATMLTTGAVLGTGFLGPADASVASGAAVAAAAAPSDAAASAAVAATYDGEAVQTRYGAFQASITVVDGVVTEISWLQEGESDPHSQRINEEAVPELVDAILAAQSVDVGYISGASYTSQGVEEAVQSAFEQAGLA